MSRFGNGKRVEAAVLAACLSFAACLSGCTGGGDDPEENRVIVEQEAAPVDYKLTAVSRGDVVLSENIRCTYTQLNSQQISFEVSGKMVSKVYVRQGDEVKKGDLLAELSGGAREAEIEELEYRLARNRLLLEQVDETENYELSRRWLENIYNGNTYGTDDIPNLQKNNEYSREDYRDAIAMDEQRLEQVRREVRQSRVYAELSGSVYSIKADLEGSTSVKDEVVMEIMDNSQCVFTVSNTTYAAYIKEGQILDLSSVSVAGVGQLQVEPYRMDQWEDAMYFSLVDNGEEISGLEAGATAFINLTLEERKNVLTLPTSAVQKADDKWYVYVVSETGTREVKWIEVGLQSRSTVEITGGLEEGEKVVQR